MLVLCAALLGYRQGWLAANMTETAAIEMMAGRYTAEAGAEARPFDCWAQPGEGVWLVVRCERDGARWEYHVNRFGGLERWFGPQKGKPLTETTKEPRT
jgi:L-asparaginase II